MSKLFLVTGRPGVGKTSLIIGLIDKVREKGYSVGGIVSKEFRRNGVRHGFEILDLLTGRKGILASSDLPFGPRIGKYKVNLKDLKDIAADSLDKASDCDLIVCDEVGPMELLSPEFKRALRRTLEGERILLFSVHYKIRDPLIEELLAKGQLFELNIENRGELKDKLFNLILESLEKNAYNRNR
ncbi:MAG: NTPase [Nitrososphaerales archaeon]